ncbi:MAG: hypothetical protein ACXIT9_08955 [Nitritalea sp.]
MKNQWRNSLSSGFLLGLGAWLLFGSQDLSAQQMGTGIQADENLRLAADGAVMRVVAKPKEDTKGSPFFFEEELQGTPYSKGEPGTRRYFNFHGQEKRMVMRAPNGNLTFLEVMGADSVVFVDEKITFVNAAALDKSFEDLPLEKVTVKGGKKLYLLHDSVFTPADYEGGYNADRPYDEYYFRLQAYEMVNGKLEKVKFNRKWVKTNVKDFKGVEPLILAQGLRYNEHEDQMKILDLIRD